MTTLLVISSLIILLDQAVKLLITHNLVVGESIKIINNFFYITYVNNSGAAWSILTGNRILLIVITLLVLFIIYKYLIKDKKLQKIEQIIYGLLVGGVIGNLIDRVVRGYVIDYLDFYIFNYDYPIFNIADAAIVIAVILLIYLIIKGDKYDSRRK